MAKVLTTAAVEKIKPTAARQEIPDARMQGLYLVVQPSGAKSWAVRYRLKGKPAKFTLGRYPRLEIAAARKQAGAILETVAKSEDPAAPKRAAKAAAPEQDTFERVADDFLKRHVERKRERTVIEYRRPIEKLLKPRWRNRLVKDITKRDVIEVLDELVDAGKPVAANRTFALVRKLFNWCLARDIIAASPIAGLRAPTDERARQRVLTDDELRLLWPVFGQLGHPFGPWMQVLLLTGQRRDEVSRMRWRDLDLEQKLWRIPTTKSDRPHLVPLAPAVVAILEALPRFKGPFVFSTTGGERPISGFSVAKRRVDRELAAALAQAAKAAGREREPVPAWVVHDMRRTVRTNLSRLRVPPHVAELVLNHSIRGIQPVYDVDEYLDERRHALGAWASLLQEIVDPSSDKVVVLQGRRDGA
jgi:integrase